MRTIQTRYLLLKKQWLSLLFWLIFPVIVTCGVLTLFTEIEKDARIPVGLVIQEDSPEVTALVNRIKESDILMVDEYEEAAALQALLRHEVDSVFIINEGYHDKLANNQRDDLITGYQSNLSFTYMPVKEMIVAFVQKDAGSAKAVEVIQQLQIANDATDLITWEAVTGRVSALEEEALLLDGTMSFAGEEVSQDTGQSQLLNPFYVWVIALTLATFFIFDWIIRERTSAAAIRLQFTRKSLKVYLLEHFIVYTVILAGFDVLSLYSLTLLYEIPRLSWEAVVAFGLFRITLNLTAFLLAVNIRKLSLYYSLATVFTLLMGITSTAILPMEHMYKKYTWLYLLNPLQPLIHNEVAYLWLGTSSLLLVIWFMRRGRNNA